MKRETVKDAAELGVGDWVKVSGEWLNMEDFIHHVYLIFEEFLKNFKLHGLLQQTNHLITINTP